MRQPPAIKISFARRSSAFSRFNVATSQPAQSSPQAGRRHQSRRAGPTSGPSQPTRSGACPRPRRSPTTARGSPPNLRDHPHRTLPQLRRILARSSHNPDLPNSVSARTRREVSVRRTGSGTEGTRVELRAVVPVNDAAWVNPCAILKADADACQPSLHSRVREVAPLTGYDALRSMVHIWHTVPHMKLISRAFQP